jgi:hypothetical protein
MIVLRSIPLSFSVFWRFLVVLPLFAPIALAVVLSLSLILPFLAGVFSSIAMAFAALLAIRGGLQARGASLTPVFRRLLVSSIQWGLFETVVYAVIGISIGLALWLATPFGPSELSDLVRQADPDVGLEFLTSSPAVLAIGLGGLCLIYGLSLSFSVPKAAAAYSAGEKVRPLDFFWGFGTSFFSLAVVMIAAGVIALFSGALFGTAALVGYGFGHVVAWITQGRPPAMPAPGLAMLAGLALIQIWTYCWFYAACALAFLRQLDRVEAEPGAERIVPQAEPVDVRALRKSRE